MAVEFIGMIGTRPASELEGASAALTGEQVAESLVDYYDAGVTMLLTREFNPVEDTIAYGRDVIPLVRIEVARRQGLRLHISSLYNPK